MFEVDGQELIVEFVRFVKALPSIETRYKQKESIKTKIVATKMDSSRKRSISSTAPIIPNTHSKPSSHNDILPVFSHNSALTDEDLSIAEFAIDDLPTLEGQSEIDVPPFKADLFADFDNLSEDIRQFNLPNDSQTNSHALLFQSVEGETVEAGLLTSRERNKLVKEVKALAMKQKDSLEWLGELMRDIGEIFSEIRDFSSQTGVELESMGKNSVKSNYVKATLSDLKNVPTKVQTALADLTNFSSLQIEPEVLYRILERAPAKEVESDTASPILSQRKSEKENELMIPIRLDLRKLNLDEEDGEIPMDIIDLVVETELSQLSLREDGSGSTDNNSLATPRYTFSPASIPQLQPAPGFKIEEPISLNIPSAELTIDINKKASPYTNIFVGKGNLILLFLFFNLFVFDNKTRA